MWSIYLHYYCLEASWNSFVVNARILFIWIWFTWRYVKLSGLDRTRKFVRNHILPFLTHVLIKQYSTNSPKKYNMYFCFLIWNRVGQLNLSVHWTLTLPINYHGGPIFKWFMTNYLSKESIIITLQRKCNNESWKLKISWLQSERTTF